MANRPTIVVSGGAGYLGRCISSALWEEGYAPICLDNFSTSHPFESEHIPCFKVDLTDEKATLAVWDKLPTVAGMFHFAARALVQESNEIPGEYFRNNLFSTLTLAGIAAKRKIPFIHSSSCSVYGIPLELPIREDSPREPISPYGETKRASEEILRQFCQTQGLRALNLRYFNPAGALNGCGEAHEPETHLVPNVLRAGLRKQSIPVFGLTHPTQDGSCVRDFIHVEDLAEGHLKGLSFLEKQKNGFWDAINLGSGEGKSVLEVIATAQRVLGLPIEIEKKAARPGDPPILIASIEKATRVLGFKPTLGLEAILKSQWAFESVQKPRIVL